MNQNYKIMILIIVIALMVTVSYFWLNNNKVTGKNYFNEKYNEMLGMQKNKSISLNEFNLNNKQLLDLNEEELNDLINEFNSMQFNESKEGKALTKLAGLYSSFIELIELEKKIKEKWLFASGFNARDYCEIIGLFEEIDNLNEEKIIKAEELIEGIKTFNSEFNEFIELNESNLKKFIEEEKPKNLKEKSTTIKLKESCK